MFAGIWNGLYQHYLLIFVIGYLPEDQSLRTIFPGMKSDGVT